MYGPWPDLHVPNQWNCLMHMFERLGAKEVLPQRKAASDLYGHMCMCQTRNLSGADV